MPVSKVMDGASAKFGIFDPQKNSVTYKGIVSSVSYGVTYDHQVAAILGRYTPAAIQHTAVEAVGIQATGWRTFEHGPHVEMSLPKVQELLLYEPIVLIVTDRRAEAQGNQNSRTAVIHSVIPVSYSTGFTAKNMAEMNVSYVGILIDDESSVNVEHPTAMQFPG